MNKSFLISFKIVFSNHSYLILASLFALGFFYLITLLYGYSLLKLTLSYSSSILPNPLDFITLPWLIFLENTEILSRVLLFIVAILSGINIAMFVYYFRRRLISVKQTSSGFFGMTFALLGVGCASCGSILLSSVIGLGTTTAILAILPFNGVEISVLGIIIILFSIYFLALNIKNPTFCKVGKNLNKNSPSK